jgi:hypothetical protein
MRLRKIAFNNTPPQEIFPIFVARKATFFRSFQE